MNDFVYFFARLRRLYYGEYMLTAAVQNAHESQLR